MESFSRAYLSTSNVVVCCLFEFYSGKSAADNETDKKESAYDETTTKKGNGIDGMKQRNMVFVTFFSTEMRRKNKLNKFWMLLRLVHSAATINASEYT